MKRQGFSSNSCGTRNRRGFHRVLVAAGVLALGVSLSSSPAQAGVVCKVQDFRACGNYICCLMTCVYCIDTVTGDLVGDQVCSDPVCWSKYN